MFYTALDWALQDFSGVYVHFSIDSRSCVIAGRQLIHYWWSSTCFAQNEACIMSAAVTASVLNYEWVCVDKLKGAPRSGCVFIECNSVLPG